MKDIGTSIFARRMRCSSAVAVGLAMVLASAHGNGAEPRSSSPDPFVPELTTSHSSEPEAPPGVLRVQVVDAIDDASLIPGWIAGRNPRIAEQLPSVEGREQWIAVEISGATYDYWISVTPMRDGKRVGPAVKPRLCECNSERLLTVTDIAIAEAVETLQAHEDSEGEAAVIEVSTTTNVETDHASVEPTPRLRQRRFTGLGIGGAMLTGIGTAAVGGGVAMLMIESYTVPKQTALDLYLGPPGYAAFAGGGALLLAGTTMLIVDAVRCRRHWTTTRCEGRRQEKLEITPAIGARHGGISVSRRF